MPFFSFFESENQINQPADKRDKGNNPPECLEAQRTKILARHIKNGQAGQYIKDDADDDPFYHQGRIHIPPSRRAAIWGGLGDTCIISPRAKPDGYPPDNPN